MEQVLKCLVTKKDGGNKFTAYASTLSVDRDSDIVMPDSYVAHKETYMKNPVLLQFHDYWKEPVGKVTSLTHDDKGIIMDIEFAPTDDGQKFAKLYNGGFMSAFSIGFIGKSYARVDSEEYDGLVTNNPSITRSSIDRIYTEIELLEVSCVPVPSNRDAVVIGAKSFLQENNLGDFDTLIEELKKLKESVKGEGMTLDEIKALIEKDGLGVDEIKSLAEEHKLSPEDLESLIKEVDGDEEGEGEGEVDDSEAKELAKSLGEEIKEIVKSTVEDVVESVISEIESSNEKMAEELKGIFAEEVKALGDIVKSHKKTEKKKEETESALGSILDELKNFKK